MMQILLIILIYDTYVNNTFNKVRLMSVNVVVFFMQNIVLDNEYTSGVHATLPTNDVPSTT
jgi:hypothetical protein